ncbi:MAG: Na/Pi cotransporter family protein [Sulfurospirillum sp.]|nr:Na/Pi cotransporter family protein [Sulfurospirillum sp.]
MKRFVLLIFFALLSYFFLKSKNTLDIAAGVAIFLFGMLLLEEGFRAFCGGFLENILKNTTDTLPKSISFGVISTTIMQSSSLVSIISISFISAGMISLYQGIGIILGANIGTTTGAWLVVTLGLKVDIAAYAMPMIVFGVILVLQSNKKLKGFGQILAGLGFLFLGIAYMKEGFEAFKQNIDLSKYAIEGFKGLILFALLGFLATIIMQSSHATMVLIITALAAHQITYENSLALAIGSNVGTTVTAIIGSLSSDINGKKLAGAHFIFNILTGIIAILFINQLMFVVDYSVQFIGLDPQNYTLKLALFHTYFNVLGVLIILPFIHQLIKFLNTYIAKQANNKEDENDDVWFINQAALDFADTANIVLFKEAKHLYNNVFEIIAKGLSVTKEDIMSGLEIEDLIARKNVPIKIDMDLFYLQKIKEIYGKIINFAVLIQGKFNEEEHLDTVHVRNATMSMVEAFKASKHMQKNMLKYITSDNEHIKSQYNQIRKFLIKHLRHAQIILNTGEEDVAMLLINKIELETNKYAIASNNAIDTLIRNNHITYTMATSLMNDNSYAMDISMHLLKIVKELSQAKEITKGSQHELLLNTDEIKDVMNATHQE